jgi:hypothetical protein
MNYKPPLHIINKEKPQPQSKMGPTEHSEGYKISFFTLPYRIKGAAIGLVLAIFYCNVYLNDLSEKYLLAGVVAGWCIGWMVGRFFYTSNK